MPTPNTNGPPSNKGCNYRILCLILLFLSVLQDPSGNMKPFVLVVYKFDGVPEHTVLVRPHGNAKDKQTVLKDIEKYKKVVRGRATDQEVKGCH